MLTEATLKRKDQKDLVYRKIFLQKHDIKRVSPHSFDIMSNHTHASSSAHASGGSENMTGTQSAKSEGGDGGGSGTFIVIDIETTGFNIDYDAIVEIGAVFVNPKKKTIEKAFDQIVFEENFRKANEKSWIFENSDLTWDEVAEADKIDVFHLQTLFDLYPITAWNLSFDAAFLENRKFRFKKLNCPMKASTNYFCIPGKFKGHKWPSVQEAWDLLFTEYYAEKHRAFDDAMHEAKIILELIKKGVYKID